MALRANQRLTVTVLVSLFILAAVIAVRVAFERTPRAGVDAFAVVPVSTQTMIARLQERIRTSPDDTEAYAQLGWALLQQVRETGDAALYARAELAFGEALRRDAQHLDAMIGMGSLALSRHQFAEAIRWGEQARAINPYRAQIYGIIADGQIELGRYDQAVATLQKMIDTRPDLNSYSRVSYARELHGDTAGAIDAMKRAVSASNPQAEGTLWAQVQLGHLYFNSGDLTQAEAAYKQALQVKPDYVYAQAGIARVKAARGEHAEAIALYHEIVERLPLPEFVIAMGELYEASGQTAQAQQQYALVRAIQQLHASAGVDVDLELALFEAEHGDDPAKAVAQARAAYSRRPTVYAADALAWALYHAGDYAEAKQYSQRALRLGTRDASLHYHAGMIADQLQDAPAARQRLAQALSINPAFSILHATRARQRLAQLKSAER